MGDQVLARTSRGVALTPAGSVVLDRGRTPLRTADQMATEVRAVADGRAGRLRVASEARSTAHFTPRVVAALECRAPDVRIDMTSVSSLGEEIALLTAGEVEPADLGDEPVVGPHATVPREVSRFGADDPRPDGRAASFGAEARTPEECLQLVAAARGVRMAPASVVDYVVQPRPVWLPVADGTPFALAVAWVRGRRSNLLDVLVTHARHLATAATAEPPPPA